MRRCITRSSGRKRQAGSVEGSVTASEQSDSSIGGARLRDILHRNRNIPMRPVIPYIAIVLAMLSGRTALAATPVLGNLLVNPSFEIPFTKNQWTYGPASGGQGIATR